MFLFTDVVDSTLVQNRSGSNVYLQSIGEHDKAFKAALGSVHGGRMIERTGDGFLAEVSSPSEAVNVALYFQHALRTEIGRAHV